MQVIYNICHTDLARECAATNAFYFILFIYFCGGAKHRVVLVISKKYIYIAKNASSSSFVRSFARRLVAGETDQSVLIILFFFKKKFNLATSLFDFDACGIVYNEIQKHRFDEPFRIAAIIIAKAKATKQTDRPIHLSTLPTDRTDPTFI